MNLHIKESHRYKLLAILGGAALAMAIVIGLESRSTPLSPATKQLRGNASFDSLSNHQSSTPAIGKSREKISAAIKEAYGKFPLSFEVNKGQTDARVSFSSRGSGYAVFLTSTGAALSLNPGAAQKRAYEFSEGSPDAAGPNREVAALFMRLKGIKPNPVVKGIDELPGKVNYLIGNDPGRWRTNVSTFARVRYEDVYPGIDLVYYGNQRQLEYDFELKAGANLQEIRLAFDGADDLTLNERGDLIIKTKAGDVTLLKPVAFQESRGQKRECPSQYLLGPQNEVSFNVVGYDQGLPLVIDPVLVYSTYLGGTDYDEAWDIAADSSGSAYITGRTFSSDFPVASPIQPPTGNIAEASEVFVTKLNSTGSAMIYSTFLGGGNADIGKSIAIDSAGNAYVTGQTSSSDFPTANPLHPGFSGIADAFVAELNPTGSALLYSTYLGGGGSDIGNSVAVDGNGQAYVTGQTNSRDFPTSNPLQSSKFGNALFKTSNGAGNWNPSDAGMTGSIVTSVALDPTNSSILFAATESGLFKSSNGGATWTAIASQQIPTPVIKIAIDPTDPSVLYAASNGGVFRSADGGSSFSAINNGLGSTFIRVLAIDPATPTTVYAADANRVYKTTNSGNNWTSINLQAGFINALAIDPGTPSTIYAGTNNGVYKSINAGSSWAPVNTGISSFQGISAIAIDSTNTSVLYAGTNAGILKSTNGAGSWTNISGNLGDFVRVTALALDPTNPSTVYLGGGPSSIVYKTTDGGVTWNPANTGYVANSIVNSIVVDPTNSQTLYVAASGGSEVFVTKLAPAGTAKLYSTFLGGIRSEVGNGIAHDGNGNAYITGYTFSLDFPLANALQPAKGDPLLWNDAFVTKINSTGSALLYSTYLGGELADMARDIAVSGESAYVVGETSSPNFPVVNPIRQAPTNFDTDAFITKVSASGSSLDFSTCLGGTGTDQGFGIAVDSSGVYVTGATGSSDFPTLAAPQPAYRGNDAFVTKLNSLGSALIYSTYLGGTSSDQGNGVAIDSSGNAYVVGTTSSANFPVVNPFQATLEFIDGFVAKIGPSVDLAVTMTDSPDPVLFGNNLTYNITIRNDGELTATGVTFIDILPSGSGLVTAMPSQGTCSGSSTITCNLDTLTANSSATIELVIKPPAIVTISNTGTVVANESDPHQSNNSRTETTQVVFSDLAVENSSASDLAATGSTIAYFLTVQNLNGGTATSINVTDTLPDGVTFVSCNAPGGACGGAGNNRTVSFPSLPVGASAGATIFATVNNSVESGTVLTASAVSSSSVPDPNLSNNSSSTSVTVSSTLRRPKANGQIAFATDGAPTLRLKVVNSDGTGLSNLTNGQNYERKPAWAPDGSKVAFQGQTFSSSGSTRDIYVINADGTGQIKLTDTASNEARPTWSPSGKRIAFVGRDFSIYTISVAGGAATKLIDNSAIITGLDWSPDGTKLAFEKNGDIYTIKLDGSSQTKITTHPGQSTDSNPRWSPDGNRVLFTRDVEAHVVNSDGSDEARLLNIQGSPNATWSPDGLRLAFGQNEISVINVDGTGLTQLTDNSGGSITYKFEPDWQPLPNSNPTPTPTPAPSYSLSGRVTSEDGQPFSTQIQLSGPITVTRHTNGGDYDFVSLPAGEYTVTPVSFSHSFSPQSRTVTISNANVTGVDFVATFVPANITGRVTDNNGNPLSGIRVTTYGGFPEGSTFTDASGFYSFPNVQRGRTYAIYADPFTHYIFTPPVVVINFLQQSQEVNFVGTLKNRKTGVFRPTTGELFLKNSNSSGFADTYIIFGNPGDYPIAGDWNGDGIDSVGIYRNGVFYLRNSNTTGFADVVIPFGNPTDQPVVGDWNGDGVDTIGIYRNGTFYLRNSNTAGAPDLVFTLGDPGDVAIAGDWNGDGIVTAGVFRPSNGIIYLKNSNTTGFADISFVFGNAGDKPVAGDWDGDGIDTIGIYRGDTFYLRNSNNTGFADLVFVLGNNGDSPIAGNWNGSP